MDENIFRKTTFFECHLPYSDGFVLNISRLGSGSDDDHCDPNTLH